MQAAATEPKVGCASLAEAGADATQLHLEGNYAAVHVGEPFCAPDRKGMAGRRYC